MTDIPHEPSALDLVAASAANAQSRRRRARLTNAGIGVAGFLALLLIWKVLIGVLQVPAYILPAPEGVFVALWSGIASPRRARSAITCRCGARCPTRCSDS